MNENIVPISNPTQASYDADDIHLSDLVRILWRRRWMIFGLSCFGALLGLGASLASQRYVSEGLFLVNVPFETYKRYEVILTNGPRLAQFVQQSGTENAAVSARILSLAENDAALRKALRPEFGFTDKDAKAFGVQAGNIGNTVDVRLRFESPDSTGGAPVALLAEFVRDTIIRVDMENTMLGQCGSQRVREQTLRNGQIQSEFDIRQQEARAATLRTLALRHSDAMSRDVRQIVAMDKGTERFLPLQAQLAAVEIQIADMRLDDARREREQVASALKRSYYCKAQEILQGRLSGRAFFSELVNIQNAVFEGKDRNDTVVEQTWNELDVQRQNWNSTYLTLMRFVAPPDGAEVRERKLGITTAVVLGLMLGGLIGVFGAFVLGWWRNNQHAIEATRGG